MVLPLDDRSAVEQANVERPTEEGPRDEYTYYPGAAPVPESVAVNILGCSYKIMAEVQILDGCAGVIFAHGSRFGGHSLFIMDKKLYYVYNFLGIPDKQYKLESRRTHTQPQHRTQTRSTSSSWSSRRRERTRKPARR